MALRGFLTVPVLPEDAFEDRIAVIIGAGGVTVCLELDGARDLPNEGGPYLEDQTALEISVPYLHTKSGSYCQRTAKAWGLFIRRQLHQIGSGTLRSTSSVGQTPAHLQWLRPPT